MGQFGSSSAAISRSDQTWSSALSLIWAVLELSSRGWRGVTMTPKTVAEIERLRRHQRDSAARDEAGAREEAIAA